MRQQHQRQQQPQQGATCEPLRSPPPPTSAPPSSSSSITAEGDGLIRMENVCFGTRGPLVRAYPTHGRPWRPPQVFGIEFGAFAESRGVVQFLSSGHAVPSENPCVISNETAVAVVLPLVAQDTNVAHVFTRYATAVRLLAAEVGDGLRNRTVARNAPRAGSS